MLCSYYGSWQMDKQIPPSWRFCIFFRIGDWWGHKNSLQVFWMFLSWRFIFWCLIISSAPPTRQCAYLWVYDSTADWDVTLTVFALIGSALWIICAVIYMWAFFKGDFEVEENGPKPLRLSTIVINSIRGKSSLRKWCKCYCCRVTCDRFLRLIVAMISVKIIKIKRTFMKIN